MMPRSLAHTRRIARLATLCLAISFKSARAYGDPPPDPPFLYIGQVVVGRSECDTCAPRVCAGQPALVTVRGEFQSSCYTFRSLHLAPNRGLYPVVIADIVVDTCGHVCANPISFSGSVELPPMPAGTYQFEILEQARRCPDTTVVSSDLGRVDSYVVLADCGSPPPPPPPADSLVRTFVKLAIAPEHPCAGDSVMLQLQKVGCPPCVHLVSFGPTPGDSTIRGVVNWIPICAEFRCAPETLSTPMGRMNSGFFTVSVPITVHVIGTPNPDSTISFQSALQFEVGQQPCGGPPGPCVARPMRSTVPPGQCAVTLAPGAYGDVPLFYTSALPMAGLQGTIQLMAPFQLVDLQLAGGLAGVHLSRQREGLGARWVVFTDPGVTLAPGARQHLLNARVTVDPGALNGTSSLMAATITLAAGPDGGELPLCIRYTADVAPIRLCVAGEPSLCDVNHDGRLDVRDLVRMAGCLRHDLVDTTGACVDCNQDSTFDIRDIFCCASAILRGPGVPRDSVRTDDSLRVSIGQVYAVGDDRIVHVRVTGARALGATSIRFDYPPERWLATQLVRVDQTSQPVDVDWYPLIDLEDPGHVYLGALRLGDSGGEDAFEFEILMHATSAPLSGDQLVGMGAEFGARDGAVIAPSSALPVLSLTAPETPEPGPGVGPLALSQARPNPFNTSTSFVVTLPGSSQLDLSVHDLAGRRVATLAHGKYSAGRQLFTWDGAGVHDGLYFVQLTVNGEVRSTRVALLRNTH